MTIVISTGHVATIVTGSTQKKPTRHISPIRERDALAHIDRSAPTSRRRTTIDCRVEKKKVNKNQHAESFLPSIDIYWPGDETVGKCRKEKKKKTKQAILPQVPSLVTNRALPAGPVFPWIPFPAKFVVSTYVSQLWSEYLFFFGARGAQKKKSAGWLATFLFFNLI